MANNKKVINFGAGPSKLPEQVMEGVQKELLDYKNTGISVIEMSHRSSDYSTINNNTQNLARDLLKIPDTYSVLFLQGGGTGLFAAVAMNLMSRTGTADYVVTGSWSAKAVKEAEKYGKVNLVLPKRDKYLEIPDPSSWKLDPNASYVYYCDNETVNGVEFQYVPDTKGVPLVVDMSSNFMSRPIDVEKFGVIFAGAQKNIGPAGVVMVIIRKDLLGNAMPICPLVLDFTVMHKDNSLHNTPPTFSVFIIMRVLEWVKQQGGVEEMERRALEKSTMLYGAMAASNGFYVCHVNPDCRSRMNVPFRISAGEEVEAKFLSEAQNRGMMQLKGHRSVGGIRASIYNAVTIEETKFLVNFMNEFYKANSK